MEEKNFSPRIILEGIGGAFGIALTILFSPLLRPWYSRWGASQEEAHRPMPGDELVPRPRSKLTCAITIRASAGQIWPWLVQLGCQRAGWYSYDLLDNGGIPSARKVIDGYQQLQVGDVVKAVPKGDFGFPVAAIHPERALVLGGTLDTRTGKSADPNDPALESYYSGNNIFFLDPQADGSTRLYFRCWTGWNPTFLTNLIYGGILGPVTFRMGRKMLINLKQRIEAAAMQPVLVG